MNWKLVIDVSEIWGNLEDLEDDDEKVKSIKSDLIPKLETYKPALRVSLSYDVDELFDFDSILSEMKEVDDIDEFDNVWNYLYVWADNNRIFIQTV